MNGDHYEEQICPTCGLGMATECRGHDTPCPKCGSNQPPYFSRIEPMGYFCPACGVERKDP